RKPGAVTVPARGKVDAAYDRTVPEGGLVLKVHTRVLDRDKRGQYTRGTSSRKGGDQAARDHAWLTKAEWQSLVPAKPREGDTFAMPAAIGNRLLRFHLIDNTRGEPPFWGKGDVRKAALTWKVTKVSDAVVAMELTGAALLATDADTAKAARGFDVAIRGAIEY